VITPTEWQQSVMAVPLDVSLFLGGGRGRGATTCANFMNLRACDMFPDSHHLFIRNQLRSLAEVEDSTAMMAVGVYGSRAMKINRSDHVFKFPNGSTLEFAPLADINDVAKLQGRSFATITADEVGNMSPAQIRWTDSLRANLRGSDCPKRMAWLANPAGRAHSTLRTRFVSKMVPRVPTVLDDGVEWVFTPATYKANPHLPKTYERDLMAAAGRDGELYRSWAEGSWDTAKGAILADVLDSTVQMFDAKDPGFNIHHPACHLYLSGDWGVSSPSVVYLCARLLAPLGRYPRGSLLLVSEVHSADPDDLSVGLQWSPSYLADRVNEMCDEFGMRNRHGVLDNARGLSDDTVHSIMAKYGLSFTTPVKGIVANLSAMRELLFNSLKANNRPGMWVSNRCPGFWETVPVLPRDNLRPEIPDTKANDHFYDGAAYAVSHEPRIARIGINWRSGLVPPPGSPNYWNNY
jgi:hypothetical protein